MRKFKLKICKECNKLYMPAYNNQKQCSEECRIFKTKPSEISGGFLINTGIPQVYFTCCYIHGKIKPSKTNSATSAERKLVMKTVFMNLELHRERLLFTDERHLEELKVMPCSLMP